MKRSYAMVIAERRGWYQQSLVCILISTHRKKERRTFLTRKDSGLYTPLALPLAGAKQLSIGKSLGAAGFHVQ